MGLASLVVVAVPAAWGMSDLVTHHALQGVAQQSEQVARLTVAPVLTLRPSAGTGPRWRRWTSWCARG